MRAVLFLAVWLFSSAAAFADAQFDGNWLRKGVDASARIESSSSTTDADFGDAMLFIGYAGGFLAAHRQNNMTFAVVSMVVKDNPKQLSPDALKMARAFVPLITVPDNVSVPQIGAIIRKYLDANPNKWHEPANVVMLNALKKAFPTAAR